MPWKLGAVWCLSIEVTHTYFKENSLWWIPCPNVAESLCDSKLSAVISSLRVQQHHAQVLWGLAVIRSAWKAFGSCWPYCSLSFLLPRYPERLSQPGVAGRFNPDSLKVKSCSWSKSDGWRRPVNSHPGQLGNVMKGLPTSLLAGSAAMPRNTIWPMVSGLLR